MEKCFQEAHSNEKALSDNVFGLFVKEPLGLRKFVTVYAIVMLQVIVKTRVHRLLLLYRYIQNSETPP